MAAIWNHDGQGWRLMAPTGFPDEATLHSLVEQAPHMLPLVGSPRLVVLAREAVLGTGYADLIAVEPSGRLVIIEVKLARNAEARRAVIAQILTYAAYLRGMDPATLEQSVLGRHLRQRNYESLAAAVAEDDQEGSFDPAVFASGLEDSLAHGRFRLVLVLDTAPEELVRLVGYLEAITDTLTIDLITVSAYDVNGSQILVPQRVGAEPQPTPGSVPPKAPPPSTGLMEGAGEFVASIEQAREEHRLDLRRLADWAISLEQEGLVRLYTYRGKSMWTLLPRLQPENVGLVTIYNQNSAYLTLSRSVFMRRAPNSIAKVEERIAPTQIGKNNVLRRLTDDVLEALTVAYREAVLGRTTESP